MKNKEKKYILENAGTKSIQDLSRELGLKERTVRKLLKREKRELKTPAITSFMHELRLEEKDIIFKTLLAVLVVGFALRLAGIFWGTPLLDPLADFYHPDEGKIVNGAVGFPQHIMTNVQFTYTTFYPYLIGILSLPLRLIFGQETFQYYCYTHLLGRICSVFIGTGTILATYFLAKKIYDRKRALLAGAFICLSLYHCQDSSWTTVDVLTSLWTVLFFLAARKAIIFSGTMKDYLWAGVIFGCSVGTKQTCLVLIIVFLTMVVYSAIRGLPEQERGRYIVGRVFNPKLFLFGIVSVVSFFITTPGFLIHFHEFIDWNRYVAWENYRYYLPRTDLSVWVKLYHTFTNSIGLPLTLLFIFGLIVSFREKKVEILAAILLFLAYFGYLGNIMTSRYIIIVMPLIAVIASHGIVSLYESKQNIVRFFAGAVIAGTVVYSFLYCAGAVYLRLNDTRTGSAHYIEENIPQSSTIGIAFDSDKFHWRYHGWKYPKINFEKYKEEYFLNRPDILVLSSFDFVQIEEALKSDKLKEGYVWDEAYNKEWYNFAPPPPSFFQFYDELLNKHKGYVLLKAFKRNNFIPISFQSPEIRIYKRI